VVRSDPRTPRFDARVARRQHRGGRRHAHRDHRSGQRPVAQQRRRPATSAPTGRSRWLQPVLLPAENGLAVLTRAGPSLRMLPWDDELKARQDGHHLPLRRRVVAGPARCW
jgi:hypothetical protein